MEYRGWRIGIGARASIIRSSIDPLSSILHPLFSSLDPLFSSLDPPSSKHALPRDFTLARSADSHSHARAEVQPVGREPEYLLIVLVEQVLDSGE
jgi:hypothetical protein